MLKTELAERRIQTRRNLAARCLMIALLPACLFFPTLEAGASGQTPLEGKSDQDKLYGGIEIGPEGIKAAVLRFPDAEQGAGPEVIFTQVSNPPLARARDGKPSPETIRAAGQTIRRLYTRLRQRYQVPSRQIYIVGGSELRPSDLAGLMGEVESLTGKPITFLSLESEVRLGIIGTIPRRYRMEDIWLDNRSQSVLIDVGLEHTTAGYQQIRQPLLGNQYYDFVAIGIPMGTATIAREIGPAPEAGPAARNPALIARSFIERSFKPALRKELEKSPGLALRKKVYLNGAIVRALAALLHPENRLAFIPITINDINNFHLQAVNAPQALLHPDLSRIRNDQIRKEAAKELEFARSTFTPQSLIAGAEFLKAVARECNFRQEGKKIFIARFSHLSVILSYVRLQAENGSLP